MRQLLEIPTPRAQLEIPFWMVQEFKNKGQVSKKQRESQKKEDGEEFREILILSKKVRFRVVSPDPNPRINSD